MNDEILAKNLKMCIANSYIMSFKAQSFHWNVEGIDFSQLHDFFGSIYSSLNSQIDTLAELIRTLDLYAPTKLSELIKSASIDDVTEIPDARRMCSELERMNTLILNCLNTTIKVAEKDSKHRAIVNALDDIIEETEKRAWMLRASVK